MEQSICGKSSSQPAAPVASEPVQTTPPAVRVWLVDDNECLRQTIAEVLTQVGGIECSRHFSSPDALLSALASKPGPDVILLDVQMGRHNGLDAVRPIKSLTRSTRVLMFTSCFDHAMRERALGDGASDYILKSKPLEYLAGRIRNPADDPPTRPMSRRRASCPKAAAPPRASTLFPVRFSRLLRGTLRVFRLL
jgi:DNA-binding NarL/FixJ family response regulator